VLAAAVSLAFLIAALTAPRASPWLTAFEALAAAVTLVMVFALQHSQARQQIALQRKLDEILRVLPGADTRLVHFETGSVDAFEAVDERHSELGARARECGLS
jgi:low affinity Fe/Cu permease